MRLPSLTCLCPACALRCACCGILFCAVACGARRALALKDVAAQEAVERAEKELQKRREEAKKADKDAVALRLVEKRLTAQKSREEKLAARLLLEAMRLHVLRKRYREIDEVHAQEMNDLQLSLDRVNQKVALQSARAFKQALGASKDSASLQTEVANLQEQLDSKDVEMAVELAKKQEEIDKWVKKEKKMKDKLKKEVAKEIEDAVAEEYQGRIKALREELMQKMNEIEKLKFGKK